MRKLNEIITGKDNLTLDCGRIALLLGVVSFIYFSYMSVAKSGVFDASAFGVGFGAVCGGVGALLKLKEGTEPDGNTHDNKQGS